MREMRRTDRKLSAEETEEILAKGEYGVLSTVCEDGTPYGIPISYAYNANDHVVYMHCSADGGQKIDNLRFNDKACLTVVLDTELMPEKFATKYWSATVFGSVQIIEAKDEKQEGMEAVSRPCHGRNSNPPVSRPACSRCRHVRPRHTSRFLLTGSSGQAEGHSDH